MRLVHMFIGISVAILPTGLLAQVKDGQGNALRAGLPTTAVADYNGGTIGQGRAAKCVLDAGARKDCTFYPRNRDGSFAIDVEGKAYYAEKSSPRQITVDYDNGARMVSQGVFTRSKRDSACWVQGAERKICVY